ncbi:MAG TPA: hypothetical protein VMZ50_14405 [Phycisphaerae bacterium]|nr:hypothetical protein [Phycisphaerae bacterium]
MMTTVSSVPRAVALTLAPVSVAPNVPSPGDVAAMLLANLARGIMRLAIRKTLMALAASGQRRDRDQEHHHGGNSQD